ncbi:MAG TPA: hypothetical protein V6C58_06445, partial [Allocoleopsis sp.]
GTTISDPTVTAPVPANAISHATQNQEQLFWDLSSQTLAANATATLSFNVKIASTATPGLYANDADFTYQVGVNPFSTSFSGEAPVQIVSSTPKALLVKRITAINTTQINGFIDFVSATDPTAADDNNSKWPSPTSTYLRGAIACTSTSGTDCNSIKGAKPGDTVEYTIYFLSNGSDDLKNLKLCDRIPTNTTFEETTYDATAGAEKGILLGWNNTGSGSLADPSDSSQLTGIKTWLTNNKGVAPDSDRGKFYSSSETLPATPCGAAANTNGGVVIDLGSTTIVHQATGSGSPLDSYGFFRFKVKVK